MKTWTSAVIFSSRERIPLPRSLRLGSICYLRKLESTPSRNPSSAKDDKATITLIGISIISRMSRIRLSELLSSIRDGSWERKKALAQSSIRESQRHRGCTPSRPPRQLTQPSSQAPPKGTLAMESDSDPYVAFKEDSSSCKHKRVRAHKSKSHK